MLEAMYEDKLEFPGGGRVQNKKTFREGRMNIIWNCKFTAESDKRWPYRSTG